jgi:hypothetical protein
MDSDDLAEVFEISPTTARTRLFRARQALRAHMERDADHGGAAEQGRLDEWVGALRALRTGLSRS